MKTRTPLRPLLLLAFLGLALGLAGWGHRLPSVQQVQLNAHQLIGLVSDLCGESGDHGDMPSCPLCTQVHAAILPKPGDQLKACEEELQRVVYLPRIARAAHRPRDPTTPLRGPPLSV